MAGKGRGWGGNIGGSTWIESICMGREAGGGHWGGGLTYGVEEDMVTMGESEWQERVGEFGEGGGGTENCCGL